MFFKPVQLLLVLLALTCAIAWANATFKVDPGTHMITDSQGRTRIFHGVNAVRKVFPWHPITTHFDSSRSLTRVDAQNLRKWGFNIVRLGTMWPGLEATRGRYNMTYLSEIAKIVRFLGDEGIVTLLDLHQDLLSPYWCGEGIPDWAAITGNLTFDFPKPIIWSPIRREPNGHAKLEDCLKWQFGLFYLSEAVNAGFQSLYDNVNGIQDSFVAFWDTVSRFFSKDQNVIGFDLINEPWVGNAFKDPALLYTPGLANRKHLAPMYDRAAAATRANARDKLVFYAPSDVDQLLGTSNGFETGPGGAAWNTKSVYSYHTYCVISDRHGNPYSRPLCDAIDAYLFKMWTDTYKRAGTGGMMTEWGALSESPGAMQQIHRITGLADEHLQSWIWWQFKDYDDVTTASIGDVESFYDSDGKLQEKKVKALSRTYAQAICGTPTLMHFNETNAHFQLTYAYNSTISSTAPTVIYLNQQWYYPSGFLIFINPADQVSWTSVETGYIHLWHKPNLAGGTLIDVKIKPL